MGGQGEITVARLLERRSNRYSPWREKRIVTRKRGREARVAPVRRRIDAITRVAEATHRTAVTDAVPLVPTVAVPLTTEGACGSSRSGSRGSRHHHHRSDRRSRSRSYSGSRHGYHSPRQSYGSSYRSTGSSGGYGGSSYAPWERHVRFRSRVDTRRYESSYYGHSGGSSYPSNSFAGEHLKDIQWDLNSLTKFEKNFYHVSLSSLSEE